jgi:hypothetical protein
MPTLAALGCSAVTVETQVDDSTATSKVRRRMGTRMHRL